MHYVFEFSAAIIVNFVKVNMLVGADTELLRAIELVYHALTGKLQLIVFFPLFFFENQIVLEFEKYHLRRALSQQDVVLHVHHQLA